MYIYTSPYPLTSVFGMYPLTFVSTLTPIDEILKVLVTAKPHLLICYPSHMRQIVDLASEAELAQIREGDFRRLISGRGRRGRQAMRNLPQ